MNFKIKVCGITRKEDAVTAVNLGVDMLGLIFYKKSPRFVSQKIAKEITAVIPATVAVVGVFVDEDIQKIIKLSKKIGFGYVQLHGQEKHQEILTLQKNQLKVINSYSVKSKNDYEKIIKSKADLVLVDNISKDLPGGSGQTFDWNLTPSINIKNLILSGGLNLSNIEKGIKKFKPIMIDVNSGVEISPGVKSKRKLKQFFSECNRLRYDN